LRVGDRGPGVPTAERERIFEKFHRVDDTLTAEKSGTGLGLSIARQLARGLGGELMCEARAGGGAEFVLTLP
jgi:signal transduction histidine kinase